MKRIMPLLMATAVIQAPVLAQTTQATTPTQVADGTELADLGSVVQNMQVAPHPLAGRPHRRDQRGGIWVSPAARASISA